MAGKPIKQEAMRNNYYQYFPKNKRKQKYENAHAGRGRKACAFRSGAEAREAAWELNRHVRLTGGR
jgi:hypothetical protein